MFRLILSSLCIIGLIFGTFAGYKKLTRGFRFHKIYANLAPNPSWDIEELTPLKAEKIETILSQKFRFLDRGTQFYVFESEDGKHVLKFFRFDRMKPTFWAQRFPDVFQPFSTLQKKNFITRLNHTMQACTMAYEKLKEKTGLVYLHLNATDNLHKQVCLVDPLGRSRVLDLNGLCFILQKKLEPLKSVMKRARDTKDSDWQQSIIRSFFDMLIDRSRVNICNTDPDVFHNFGYLDDQVIEIDFGDYIEDDKLKRLIIFESEMDKYAKTLRRWLEKHIPEQVGFFDLARKEALAKYSKELL